MTTSTNGPTTRNQDIRPASRAGQAIIIMSGLVSVSIITLALHVLQGVFRPFFIAIFLCFLVKPLTGKLGRRAGIFGYAFAIAIIFGLFSLGERVISADLKDVAKHSEYEYQPNLIAFREGLEAFLIRHESIVEVFFFDAEDREKRDEKDAKLDKKAEIKEKPLSDEEKDNPAQATEVPDNGEKETAPDPGSKGVKKKDSKNPAVQRALELIIPVKEIEDIVNPKVLTTILGSGASFFFGFFGEALVILICMLLILLETDRLPERLRRVYGEEKTERILSVFNDVNKSVQRYISLKVLISLITAIASIVIMRLFELHYVITFGIIIFLFNFVPYIGSVIATLLPCLVAILQYEPPSLRALWLALSLAGAQQFIGNIIEPRVQGKGLSISPVVIILALGFWGWLWGISGMILAVPITVTIRIILEQFETTRRPAQMMGSDG